MFEYIKEYLKINEVEYRENFKLRDRSFVKIGGCARISAHPKDERQLVELVSFLDDVKCKYKVFGKASNVLFPDEDYLGVAVFTEKLCGVQIVDGFVFAECGAGLPKIAGLSAEYGTGGFEELSGIPGSVGASVIGNAGAFGREISDLLFFTKVYFKDTNKTEWLPLRDLKFEYRNSSLKMINCLVLSCVFKGNASSVEKVRANIKRCFDKRRENQPYGNPSLGSTFKRTKDGRGAGFLIDSCGLKGFRIGGAAISEKHAGIIVNCGGATAKDYLSVAEVAALAVQRKFNLKLEKEIEVVC